MYFVNHYSIDAYYEHAEGGYYVETKTLINYAAFKSMKAARKCIKETARALEYTAKGKKTYYKRSPYSMHKGEGWAKANIRKQFTCTYIDEKRLTTKYIGAGRELKLERSYAASQRGYQPYE